MPTRTQRLLWTALPNGWSDDGRRLRVSVMLSPRLVVSPGPDDVLAAFPDLLALPALVRDARFELDLAGNVVTADRLSEPDDGIHAALFTAKTSVLSRRVEDKRGTDVLSFPVAQVERDLTRLYGELASEADGELPLLDAMRRRFAPLGAQVLQRRPTDLLDGLRQRREQAERDLDEVEAQPNRVEVALGLLAPLPQAVEQVGRASLQHPRPQRKAAIVRLQQRQLAVRSRARRRGA